MEQCSHLYHTITDINCSLRRNKISYCPSTSDERPKVGDWTVKRNQLHILKSEPVSVVHLFFRHETDIIDAFPERTRMLADVRAVCRCDPKSDCGDNCINRIMNYLCGRDCPCAERCTNKSLAKRKGPSVKVTYVSGFQWGPG